MSRLRSFLARPAAERRLWFASFVQLLRFRVLLSIRPFDEVRRLDSRPRGTGSTTARRVRWAVLSSARFVPRSTCLVQALAARRLLTDSGLPATLHVGVSRSGDGIDAHAWVDCRGELVVGDHEPGRFRELPLDAV